MTGTGWPRAWRVALSFVLAFAMVTGQVPALAFAKAAEGEEVPQAADATPVDVAPAAEGQDGPAGEPGETNDSGDPVDPGDSSDLGGAGEPDGIGDSGDPGDSRGLVRVALPVAAEDLVYDGTEKVGVPEGEGYELEGDVRATHAGDYVVTATPVEGYAWEDGTADPVEVRWSIARRPATVAADDLSKAEGEDDPELTATVEGVVDGDEVSYELSREPGEEPGEYEIMPAGDATQGDYEVSCLPGKLTIVAAGEETEAEDEALLTAQATVVASGTWGTCPWQLTSDGTLTVRPGEGSSQEEDCSPWSPWSKVITKVKFVREGNQKVTLLGSACGLFEGLDCVTEMDLSSWDVSGVQDMSYMFQGCSSLSSLNLSSWQTSSLTNADGMFYDCSSLTSLNLSGWDVRYASMSALFCGCSSLSPPSEASPAGTLRA